MKNRKAKQSKTEHHLTIDPSAGCLPGCPACEPGFNPPPLPKPQSYTPTPYTVDGINGKVIIRAHSKWIATMELGVSMPELKANAAFIVRAANNFAPMLMALKSLAEFNAKYPPMPQPLQRAMNALLIVADEAIAKAEGR